MARERLVVGFLALLFGVLIAACVTPVPVAVQPVATPMPTTAAPVEPTATPVPPTPVADPAAPIKAWAEVLNRGDVDGALAAFTDDGKYLIDYTAYDKESMRWVFNKLAGLETLHENLDCQPQDGKIACEYTVLDGCMAASGSKGLPVNALFILEDGKIKEAFGHGTGPEWDAYWDWVTLVQLWKGAFRAEESAKIEEGTIEWGALANKLCQEYATAVETQGPATTAAAQSLVDAINNGDVDAALALFTDDPKVQIWNDKVAGMEQLRAMFDWLAGGGTQYQMAECKWQGMGVQCAVSFVDGCMEAFGAPEGLPGKMTFRSREDGTLQQVIGFLEPAERKAYNDWLEGKDAWASANRAGELAQAEGYSKLAGEMAVKLCQDYAASGESVLPTPAP